MFRQMFTSLCAVCIVMWSVILPEIVYSVYEARMYSATFHVKAWTYTWGQQDNKVLLGKLDDGRYILNIHGCEDGQLYFHELPTPREDVVRWLQRNHALPLDAQVELVTCHSGVQTQQLVATWGEGKHSTTLHPVFNTKGLVYSTEMKEAIESNTLYAFVKP